MAKPGSKRTRNIPKVGVIISQFEENLSKTFDLATLVKKVKSRVQVADVVVQPYPSVRRQIPEIARRFLQRKISKVVVVGCSERLYGKLYRSIFADFNVPGTMIEFADILTGRSKQRQLRADTATAVRLVDLAVARVLAAREPEIITVDIRPLAVVVGGGIAGISAAVALASRGIEVKLIERNQDLGGRLSSLNRVFPTYAPAEEFLKGQLENLEQSGVDVITGVEPKDLKGQIGSYRLELSNGTTLECGVIIVATGADLLVPTGLFGYGERPGVITQLDLEGKLLREEDPGSNIVMIQCVGSRNEERPYCSRICCTASIKNTITIKEQYPNARITVLSRGIAEYAGDLDRAREMGVEIIRYSPERPPVVRENVVEVFDEISEMEAHIPFDLVVLAVPMIPSASSMELARILRIPLDPYGFMIEPHLRIRPEDHAPRGIFIAGTAHWPATITESIIQGYGAASRAFDLIKAGQIRREAVVARVERLLCRGCGRCYEVCEHGAIELIEGDDGIREAKVVGIHCTSCGVCVSVCPSGAMKLADNAPDLMNATVDAIRGV